MIDVATCPFYTQMDEYSCFPVAILNALIWYGNTTRYRGHDVTYRMMNFPSIEAIVKKCKTEKNYGTLVEDALTALKQFGRGKIDVEYVTKPTLKLLDQTIKNGGTIIFRKITDSETNRGHAFFIFGQTDRKQYYYGANEYQFSNVRDTPVSTTCISRKEMQTMCRQKYASCIIITKKEPKK